MNIRPLFVSILVAGSTALYAQEAPTVKVKTDDVKSTAIQTPNISAPNIPAKPFRPRNWLELDTTFETTKAIKPGESPYVDQLEFKYYIALNKTDKSGKYMMLTATVIYTNIPLKDKVHALAFVSPASLERALEKKDFTNGDIKAVGVDINFGGQTVGGKSTSGKFWDKLDSFNVIDGAILPKSKTPYAPLWGDYDVDAKVQ